ncbi:hypothetical protein M404DRAFT_1002560 [Pisolithus tinctorius Marx 270]|uniref:Uncharacterized protein n=1 Tax=Pisolithus tinctorius Marx 270 TaxID=870435 RepID=A0A0C3IZA3_PISTI|nr:hypothetical protein M404DRAFT_1002560 [Pisolithus tinctorius Marx 270]
MAFHQGEDCQKAPEDLYRCRVTGLPVGVERHVLHRQRQQCCVARRNRSDGRMVSTICPNNRVLVDIHESG